MLWSRSNSLFYGRRPYRMVLTGLLAYHARQRLYGFNIDLRMGMLQAPVVSGNVSSAQSPRIAYRTRGNRESPLRGD